MLGTFSEIISDENMWGLKGLENFKNMTFPLLTSLTRSRSGVLPVLTAETGSPFLLLSISEVGRK